MPLVSVAVPREIPSARNVTVPVGKPYMVPYVLLTLALNVTTWLAKAGLTDELTNVLLEKFPAGLAVTYGRFSEALGNWRGRPGQLNAAMAAVANDGHYFTAQKARAELALPQTSIDQAATEALAWFRAHGYV